MKICVVPIDNRPVCYNLVKDICEIDSDIELFIPPREILGDLTKSADINQLFRWLESLPQTDAMILSLDTIAYGGLIPSRRSKESYDDVKSRLLNLKPLLKDKKVYAFSSIMRISNNNYNEEEKEYWKTWGKKIFEYSYNYSKYGKSPVTDVPIEVLDDYIKTRRRNFEINKLYLEWQSEKLFDVLIFSKDDCAEYGFNVDEAKELENLGGKTKTGADEIPLTLLARALEKNISIYPIYTEPRYKNCISNYEDISIEKSVMGQLELGGFNVADNADEADIILLVNNFLEKQGELVMGWTTQPCKKEIFTEFFEIKNKPYAIADVRFANGADNSFVEGLFNSNTDLPEYGYSAWNTSANTIGSLLAAIKAKYNAKRYDNKAFKKLQLIRFLDDWAYQANVRGQIEEPCDIAEKMKPFEEQLIRKLYDDSLLKYRIKYVYPWKRKFEIEVLCKEL